MKNRKIILVSVVIATLLVTYFMVYGNETGNKVVLGKADKVLVIKSKKEMFLMRKGKVIKTYKIAMGDNPKGHKEKEGDEKTPEGNYTLDWRNDKSTCYKSIHISYPNKADKAHAKKLKVSPGGDVMIHGLYPTIEYLGNLHYKYNWTNGCIAVTNNEMDEIWKSVKNGTPIEIRK